MSHLNFNHLYYFWVVAREGSIARAAEELHVTPQTICGQLKTLEGRLGKPLFRRAGRRLELTETGQTVLSYARPMFQLGLELSAAVRSRDEGQVERTTVGIECSVPRAIALRLLAPALQADNSASLRCYTGRRAALFSDLAARRADILITEGPPSSTDSVTAPSVPVAESGLSFFAARKDAARMKLAFPQSLAGTPFLAPMKNGAVGQALFRWFECVGIEPLVIAELEDPVLMCELAEEGAGIFVQPTELETQLMNRYQVSAIGRTDAVSVTYYATHRGCSYTHALVAAMDAPGSLASVLPAMDRRDQVAAEGVPGRARSGAAAALKAVHGVA